MFGGINTVNSFSRKKKLFPCAKSKNSTVCFLASVSHQARGYVSLWNSSVWGPSEKLHGPEWHTKDSLFIYYFQFSFFQFSILEWVKWLSLQRHLIFLRVLAIVTDNMTTYLRKYIRNISIISTNLNLKFRKYIYGFIFYFANNYMPSRFASISIPHIVNVNHSDSGLCILDNAKTSVW